MGKAHPTPKSREARERQQFSDKDCARIVVGHSQRDLLEAETVTTYWW